MAIDQLRADTPEVYLDHAASTTVRTSAACAYLEGLALGPVNASGSHRRARRARAAVDDARDALAGVLGVDAGEIVFTSGGTEGDNLAVLGAHGARPGRVVSSAIEHPAVLEPVASVRGVLCGVDPRGVVRLGDLDRLLTDVEGAAATVVSVMAVNNEVGSVQPIEDVAAIVRHRAPDAVLHCDAVQALSWIDLRPVAASVDVLTMSAHKFGGPHGVGACVIRHGTPIEPRQLGGGQERDRRSGTLNVAGILAMAAAAVEADAQRAAEVTRISGLRDHLLERVTSGIEGVTRSGVTDGDDRHLAAGFAHLCIAGVENEALLFLLDEAGIAASAASACASGAQHPSHVLAAMGIDRESAEGSLRLTLGHSSTERDVEICADAVVAAVARLRRFPR